jgi:hypothetical protein
MKAQEIRAKNHFKIEEEIMVILPSILIPKE